MHQWMRKDEKYLQYKDLKKSGRIPKKPINKESPKRKVEHKYYSQLCQELWDELVVKGENKCLFCNEIMMIKEGFHHVKGRIRDNYLNKEFLFPAHNECHVYRYHQASVEQLMKEPWYTGFLQRLRDIDPQSYYKEINKQQRAELEFND